MLGSIFVTCATFLPLLLLVARFANGAPTSTSHITPLLDGYPMPELCLGNCTSIHDPSIVYEEGLYWRFTTQHGINIANAPSLRGPWTYRGALLTNGTKIKLYEKQEVWAPSVSKINDTYYCHYAVSVMGAHKSSIGVATSKTLESGSWTDHGSLDIPEGDYNLIDPYVFQDDKPDTPMYFTFGSYWSGIQQIEMNHVDQLRSYDSAASSVKNVIRNNTMDYAVVEGSTTHKHDNYYYNFFSVGQCCREDKTNLAPAGDEYHVAVCRSEHATGPYADRDGKDCLKDNGGTTILGSHDDVYAPGGGELMLDPKTHRWVIYYHYVRPSLGYEYTKFQFGFNYLDWVDGWPVLVGSVSSNFS